MCQRVIVAHIRRILVAVLIPLVVGVAPAAAGVGVRGSSSAATSSARSVAMTAPVQIVPGNVLVAMVASRFPAGSPLRPPKGWRLVHRARSQMGDGVLTQALFIHVARAGDPQRYVFRTNRRTAFVAKLLVLRGADRARTIGALRARRAVAQDALVSPPLAAARRGDLLVVELASLSASSAQPSANVSIRSVPDLALSVVTKSIRSASRIPSVGVSGLVGPGKAVVFWIRAKRPRRGWTTPPSSPTDPPPPPSPPAPPKPPTTTNPPPPGSPPAPPAPPDRRGRRHHHRHRRRVCS